MNSMKSITLAAALSAVLSVAHLGAAQAQTIKPVQGVSFHVGTKHAVSYFLDENGRCKLVLTVAEEPSGDVSNFEATRFEAAIEAGKSTRYQMAEGLSLEFTCQDQAQAMNIKSLETVAGNH
jgi:hypothetical protein